MISVASSIKQISRNKNWARVALLALLAVPYASGHAQDGPPRPGSKADPLTTFATQSGQLIGSAEYCGADPDRLTQFAVLVEARINLLEADEIKRVLARTQFKNIQTANRGKKPSADCSVVLTSFNTNFRELERAL